MEMSTEIKSINDLRSILADEIKRLRNGESTPAAVNAITNATGKILATVRLELDYSKLVGVTPNIPFIKSVNGKKITEALKK